MVYVAHMTKVRAPSWRLALSEGGRGLAELTTLPLATPMLLPMAPKGDGHPVLVLPGFIAGDTSTNILRRFLSGRGYKAYPWSLGSNFGHRTVGNKGEKILEKLEEMYETYGEKVSLVGWSLGGIIAREMARRQPDMVRQVISLGSPFNGDIEATHPHRLYKALTGHDPSADHMEEVLQVLRDPPHGIPCTSIFTKGDGVVAWQNCLEEPHHLTDNIEVRASHIGLGFNAAVFFAIADRLALPHDDWRPFDRTDGIRSLIYPSSGHTY